MRILLTNDDGLDAPGITSLYHAIKDLGEVTVVAPAEGQSAMSHAVTLNRPLVVEKREGIEPITGLSYHGYAVSGRPADCVKLAACELMKDGIDLVISGTNAGANIGVHVLYSGTVGAAREASFLGIPSIAMSLHLKKQPPRWEQVAQYARQAIMRLMQEELDASTVMNVNIPALDDDMKPKGYQSVPLSTSAALDGYDAEDLGDGKTAYQIRAALDFYEILPQTDVHALFDRWITITPLAFDLTCPTGMGRWGQWAQGQAPGSVHVPA